MMTALEQYTYEALKEAGVTVASELPKLRVQLERIANSLKVIAESLKELRNIYEG